eukprot:366458-Chlamydomonas_euryale.AAC.12
MQGCRPGARFMKELLVRVWSEPTCGHLWTTDGLWSRARQSIKIPEQQRQAPQPHHHFDAWSGTLLGNTLFTPGQRHC